MVRQARDFLSDLMHELQTKKLCKENHEHCGFNELSSVKGCLSPCP